MNGGAGATTLGRRELRRYSRHLLMPEVALAGQERLSRARVLVVGAGGLGTPVLQYLAAAGVGRIGIVDDDAVDLTNLQRQVLYDESDIGRPKATAAAAKLAARNGDVALDPIPVRFDAGNARELVRPYDLVVDATDTFGARYLVNDACRLEGKPDVFASIYRFDGQLSVFTPGGPCYRCAFPEAPPEGSVPTCAEGGVLGALAGVVGAWQASEALKVLLGIGRPLVGRLALIDALGAQMREIALEADRDCALCGDAPTIRDVVPLAPRERRSDVRELEPAQLDAFLAGPARPVLLDLREPHERALGPFPGARELPASQLDARLHELDTAATYVLACRIGQRSLVAHDRLRDAGFARLVHLRGGLLAYAAEAERFDAF